MIPSGFFAGTILLARVRLRCEEETFGGPCMLLSSLSFVSWWKEYKVSYSRGCAVAQM